jgi:hypothetical protein
MEDVCHALRMAHACRPGTDHVDTWVVDSQDLDGDAMALVVAFQDGAVIITLM